MWINEEKFAKSFIVARRMRACMGMANELPCFFFGFLFLFYSFDCGLFCVLCAMTMVRAVCTVALRTTQSEIYYVSWRRDSTINRIAKYKFNYTLCSKCYATLTRTRTQHGCTYTIMLWNLKNVCAAPCAECPRKRQKRRREEPKRWQEKRTKAKLKVLYIHMDTLPPNAHARTLLA